MVSSICDHFQSVLCLRSNSNTMKSSSNPKMEVTDAVRFYVDKIVSDPSIGGKCTAFAMSAVLMCGVW